MRPTTKTRLALDALVLLAKQPHDRPKALSVIADTQGVSLSYLEQIFAHLRKAGLARSVRGPGGGYLLGRSADCITVAEVIKVIEALEAVTRNGAVGEGAGARYQSSEHFWDAFNEFAIAALSEVTIADIKAGTVNFQNLSDKRRTLAAE